MIKLPTFDSGFNSQSYQDFVGDKQYTTIFYGQCSKVTNPSQICLTSIKNDKNEHFEQSIQCMLAKIETIGNVKGEWNMHAIKMTQDKLEGREFPFIFHVSNY